MTDDKVRSPEVVDGACHCRAIRFRVKLPQGLGSARRCTCSICRMRGAVALTGDLASFELLCGEESLGTYRFNTGVAEHHFCNVCGIYTHHRRRSNPAELGINAACLAGLSPFDFPEVIVNDGARHPTDDPEGRTHIAGVLRFSRAEPHGEGPVERAEDQ